MSDKKAIEKIDYNKTMKKSYIDYAMSVIAGRAIPDVRDGLKPVHRRILFGMYALGLIPEHDYRKSARVVGEVLGKYHPHGDTAVYEAMVRMAQDFKMGLPLIDGHGNFGSIDGDSAAAMRYTEAKLQKLGMELLKELGNDTVDFIDNFDGVEKEPVVLPAILPNLFLNGTDGIAVGMKTSIPPHNLNEICNAILAYIKKPNITTEELMKHLQGPDFPTGGYIVNKSELLEVYKTGKGKAIVRGKVEVEEGSYGKKNLIITEIPFTSSGAKLKLIENIVSAIDNKKIDEISDVIDESNKNGIRIVLEVKKNVDTDKLLNKLYKETNLQDTFQMIFLVIDKETPRMISLIEYIQLYLVFQEELMTRKYTKLLNQTNKELEVKEGLLRAIDCIDVIIEVLRGSKTTDMVKKCLLYGETTDINFKTKKSEKFASKFDFTPAQVSAILGMQLQRLVNLEIEKLHEDIEGLSKKVSLYEGILKNDATLYEEIAKNLKEIQKEYKSARKTEIIDSEIDMSFKDDEKSVENVQILIDRFGYMKLVDISSVQKSSDETISSFKTMINAYTNDKLIAFSNLGNLYNLKLDTMPISKMKDKGQHIEALLKLKDEEEIILLTTMNDLENKKLLFITDDGLCKKIDGKEFDVNRKSISAIKLNNAKLVDVKAINLEEKLIVETNKKNYIVDIIEMKDVKRTAKGEKIVKLKKGEVINSIKIEEVLNEEEIDNKQLKLL